MSFGIFFKSIFLVIPLSFVLFAVGVMLAVDLGAYKFKFKEGWIIIFLRQYQFFLSTTNYD